MTHGYAHDLYLEAAFALFMAVCCYGVLLQAVAAMSDHAEYQRHVFELRGEAEAWSDSDDLHAAYFATWLGFYMDELERSRQAHAETLSRWAQSIERRRDG